jgi:hypothetical protein
MSTERDCMATKSIHRRTDTCVYIEYVLNELAILAENGH